MNHKPDIFDIQIEKLTYGGGAMGRLPDSRAVFIPFGLPGERVRVRLTEEKKNFARGEIVEILQPSLDRIDPKCKHFGECGGCHYQNNSYEKQLQAKTDIFIDQLRRIGKIGNPPVKPMVACPNPWNYRNHVQFSLDRDGKVGFQMPNSNRVIPISECHLPESSINNFWPQLEFEPETDIERVSLRVGMDDDLMLMLESESPETPELEIEVGISIAHIYEENTVVLAGSDHIYMRVLDRDFKSLSRVVLSGEHGHGGEDGRASSYQSADFTKRPSCSMSTAELGSSAPSSPPMRTRDRNRIVGIFVRRFCCQSG
jgi:23S rRNA (uracil1939-C5)-methyltransferase